MSVLIAAFSFLFNLLIPNVLVQLQLYKKETLLLPGYVDVHHRALTMTWCSFTGAYFNHNVLLSKCSNT